jgi:hypothetical protein
MGMHRAMIAEVTCRSLPLTGFAWRGRGMQLFPLEPHCRRCRRAAFESHLAGLFLQTLAHEVDMISQHV